MRLDNQPFLHDTHTTAKSAQNYTQLQIRPSLMSCGQSRFRSTYTNTRHSPSVRSLRGKSPHNFSHSSTYFSTRKSAHTSAQETFRHSNFVEWNSRIHFSHARLCSR